MVEKAKAYGQKEVEVEKYCLGTETAHMRNPTNAETWVKEVKTVEEKEQVKIRMCEKRSKKEMKKADKKAAKKGKK